MVRARPVLSGIGALASIALVSVSVHLAAAAIPEEDSEEKAFCADTVVRDYNAPFGRMKPLHEVPESGLLPFAPRGVSLKVLDSGLRVGRGSVGFALVDSAVDLKRSLNWRVTAKLVRVDGRGHPSTFLKKGRWHLAQIVR
jgi:hypothetical protein